MKIIEGMKEIKNLERKVQDLMEKLKQYSANYDFENPTYPDQLGMMNSWLQSIHDTIKEATRLRLAIQKTNLDVIVPIELGGVKVDHSIAEWIIRRRMYAALQEKAWMQLTDKGLKDGNIKSTSGEIQAMKVRRYYDPALKDKKVEEYRSEPSIIDRTLEVVNATTDLKE